MDTAVFYNLHKKYAPSKEILNLVWSHSQIVERMVQNIIANHPELAIDKELARSGALVHDIGVYMVEACPCHRKGREGNIEPYIKHGVIGANMLRKEGLGEDLARIVERHIGTGIEKEQIIERNLPLPHKDFIPETLEEKLVGYADNFHSKKPKFNSYTEIKEDLSRYGQENVKRLEEARKLFGIPETRNV